MKEPAIRVLLADDDLDDCLLFEDALAELPISADFSTVNDGEQLVRKLSEDTVLPDVLFLDLNMPRKNGYDCLTEIMSNEKTKDLSVIIFSTSFNSDIVKLLHAKGARYYVRKPEEFGTLKALIHKGISLSLTEANVPFNKFILNP